MIANEEVVPTSQLRDSHQPIREPSRVPESRVSMHFTAHVLSLRPRKCAGGRAVGVVARGWPAMKQPRGTCG